MNNNLDKQHKNFKANQEPWNLYAMIKMQSFIFKFLFCKKLSIRPWVKPALVCSPVNWRLVPSSLSSLYFFLLSWLRFQLKNHSSIGREKFNGHQEKERRKNEDREGRKGERKEGRREGGKKQTLRHSSYRFSFTQKLEEKQCHRREQWSLCSNEVSALVCDDQSFWWFDPFLKAPEKYETVLSFLED